MLDLAGATVNPEQFYGLDVNPRAVPVAELVLWIGYLQWHFRTNGAAPPAQPILRDFRTIREADALLSYTRTAADKDSTGKPVTRWGGRTATHPITGEDVPDLTDQVLVLRPVGGKQAPWPAADFIVGNPPFVAGKDMRAELGGGYAEALWAAYPKVPPSADLAMFFWWRAAELVRAGKVRRFGFITSNSIYQVFCRRVMAAAMEGGQAAAPGVRHPRSSVVARHGIGCRAYRYDGGRAGCRERQVDDGCEGRAPGAVPDVVLIEAGGRRERRPYRGGQPERCPAIAGQRVHLACRGVVVARRRVHRVACNGGGAGIGQGAGA